MTKRPRVSRDRTILLAVAALAAFMTWQAFEIHGFISIESRPPAWDQANHLDVGLLYWNRLKQGDLNVLWTMKPKHYIPPFPPLYHMSIMWTHATANPAWNALWSNWFYLGILLFSVFGISLRLRRDAVSAVSAALAFVCAPAVQALVHTQLIDLSLTACAAAAAWAWLRCEGFKKNRDSLLLGLLFGLGMLHKWSFFSYMIPVYFSFFRAVSRRDTRRNALSFAALAIVVCLPWYLPRLPMILQRLVQASADHAVPVWEGGAFFFYLIHLPDQLGPLLFLAACAGIFLCWRRPAARPLLAVAAASYIFWAIVPNRQIRYLLPGLPGLAAVAVLALPRPAMVALAAAGVFSAANRSQGWIAPLSLGIGPVPLEVLKQAPPRREDWKIEEIVREIGRSGTGSRVVSVVANDEHFNHLNFIWTARRMGLPGIRFELARNKLWALNDFVLVKHGNLGPGRVAAGLSGIEALVLDPGGAFLQGFEVSRRWPLPDDSVAVLYQRRDRVGRSLPSGRTRLASLETPLFRFKDIAVDARAWRAEKRSHEKITLTVSQAAVRGLKLDDLALSLQDALLIPGPSSGDGGGAQLLGFSRLDVVSVEVSALAVREFLESRGVKVEKIELEGSVLVKGRFKGFPFTAELGITVSEDSRRMRLVLLGFKAGPLPIPRRLISYVIAGGKPLFEVESLPGRTVVRTCLYANLVRSFPFATRLPRYAIENGRIRFWTNDSE